MSPRSVSLNIQAQRYFPQMRGCKISLDIFLIKLKNIWNDAFMSDLGAETKSIIEVNDNVNMFFVTDSLPLQQLKYIYKISKNIVSKYKLSRCLVVPFVMIPRMYYYSLTSIDYLKYLIIYSLQFMI